MMKIAIWLKTALAVSACCLVVPACSQDRPVTGDAPPGGSDAPPGGSDAGPDDGGPGPGSDAGDPGCIRSVAGRYAIRKDGALLREADPPATTQTTILDAATVAPLDDVIAVEEGLAHGCALRGNTHTVWCWRVTGNGNLSGQLGNGTIDAQANGTGIYLATPVLVAQGQVLDHVVGLADDEVVMDPTNLSSVCAVTDDGGVYCWGDLTWLVNGGTKLLSPYAERITTDGSTPFSGAIQVAVNNNYACAVTHGATANQVWCWGNNARGGLGLGDTKARQYPTQVQGGFVNPTKVVAHGVSGTTCALDQSNVRCWGANGTGETGTGMASVANLLSPTIVLLMDRTAPLANLVDLHGGDFENISGNIDFANFCGLKTDQTFWCWGRSFQPYPVPFGVTNVLALGGIGGPANGNIVRYLTSDGMYHLSSTTRAPNCGALH